MTNPQTTNTYCVLEHKNTEGGEYPCAYYHVKFFDSENEARKNAASAQNGKTQYVAKILTVADPEMKMIFTEIT